MSSATPSDVRRTEHRNGQSPHSPLGSPLRIVGFWSAVVLPFVILSLLAIGAAQQSPELLAGLFTANVAGLVLGKDYKG